jgi:molybdate-binding protein/DNA-binding XRE family transcriptional regulator
LGEPSFSGELFDNHVYAMIADIKSGIMATRNPDNNQNSPEIENNLREKRQSAGMSQKQLADMAGITRQAVSAVEANHYSPATSVALQLARALHCRVEDLFTIKSGGEIIEGELIGSLPRGDDKLRAHVTRVGERLLVRPLDGFGELASLSATADGLILGGGSDAKHVKVQLFERRERLGRKVVVAGCDPAMFLAAEHVRRRDKYNLVPCLMGSGMAIGALKRGEVHVAGVHLADNRSGTWNLPYLERNLTGMDCFVVTFAHWEEGLILRQGNPKKIRSVADLARSGVRIVNREIGSGARRLLDGQLETCGIQTDRIKGYKDEVPSHLEVASKVRAGLADTGIGVRAAASICGLDFVPLQRERYDLVIPKMHYETLQGLKILLDTIVTRPFRAELEALGGYDTRETGAMRNLKVA